LLAGVRDQSKSIAKARALWRRVGSAAVVGDQNPELAIESLGGDVHRPGATGVGVHDYVGDCFGDREPCCVELIAADAIARSVSRGEGRLESGRTLP
jgi:hypothetical protein